MEERFKQIEERFKQIVEEVVEYLVTYPLPLEEPDRDTIQIILSEDDYFIRLSYTYTYYYEKATYWEPEIIDITSGEVWVHEFEFYDYPCYGSTRIEDLINEELKHSF